MNFTRGDLVEYVGRSDLNLLLYTGQVGRVIDDGQLPTEVAVSFLSGPSITSSLSSFTRITLEIYLRRVARLDPGCRMAA